jgi:outer membrane protein assembly factor BamB
MTDHREARPLGTVAFAGENRPRRPHPPIWATLAALAILAGRAPGVRSDEPKAAPADAAKPAEAKPADVAKPAVPANPGDQNKPAQIIKPKPGPGGQIQIQVQGGGGGGKLQINGGIFQIQGNAKVQINGGAIVIGGNNAGAANADGVDDTVFRSPDRAQLQRLTQSETMITEGRYAEAVEQLGGILEQAEDYFFRPDRNLSTSRSLKAEAQQRIGALPPAGRDAYELQYGVKAKQMLEAAVDKGDEAGLAETSRRYFHTAAGLRATYLLGLTHLDQGRPLAAALCWRRLREVPAATEFEPELSLQLATAWARAGGREPAYEVLADAAQKFPGAVLKIDGQAYRWPLNTNPTAQAAAIFRDDQSGPGDRAIAWLAQATGGVSTRGALVARSTDDWLLARGDASRNAVSTGSHPLLNRRWSVPYANHPDVEKMSERLARGYAEREVGPLPASQPLAVNGLVLMRTLGGLTAVDFRTGKRVWCGSMDDHIEHLLQRESPLSNRQDQEAGQLALLLENRLWTNAAYGSLSSDGRSVFCVEESLAPVESAQRTVIMFNGRRVMPGMLGKQTNRLAAYDLSTEGKLVWELGGEFAAKDSPLAETYFLGPPLPIGDRLYVLGETKGEVRLYVVAAATGELDWSQQLALAPPGSDVDQRRYSGLSPSFADGVLVCPTSLGAVVAIDLNDRSLLWGFQYKQLVANGGNNRMFNWQVPNNDQEGSEGDHWHDATVTIAHGKVLLAPPDGDQLHCLNLVNGAQLWQQPRDRGLYLGCVVDGPKADDQIVVVGADKVRAHRLSDGDVTWTAEWPDAAKPSGRGFYNGSLYFVPLASAEVAAVDVAAGKIVARSKSRTGTVPGNLVAYRGAILSQGVLGLECFYQLDDLRREVLAKLRQQPDDADALTSQGELLLDEGKTADAIAALRKAFAKSSDPRARNLLVDALLEGLGSGLVTAESDFDDLEKLAAGTVREETYLRLKAEAHEKAKDDVRALAAYLRLIKLPSSAEEQLRTSSAVGIGRERWVRAKLQSLYDRGDKKLRDELDAYAVRDRQAALAAGDAVSLRRYLEYFGERTDSGEVRLVLARQALKDGGLLEAEFLLRQSLDGDAAAAREATARLATMLVDARRTDEAAPYLRRLHDDYADQPVLDGKTGRQLAKDLLPGTVDLATLDRPYAWPVGKVDVVEQKQQSPSGYRSFPLEFRGQRGEYFDRMTIEMDQPQQALVGRDQYGVERWRVSMGDPQQRRNLAQMNPTVSHVRASGHLLIVSLAHELVAIDTLGDGSGKAARILWRHDLTEGLPGVIGMQGIHPRVVQMPWGVPRFMAADATGKPIGTTGPVTTTYVSYIKQRALHIVDPLSGKTLWVRHDVDSGSDVFGDEDYLFITPPGDGDDVKSTVLRVSDGEKVKEVLLPRADRRVAVYGRRLLAWGHENTKSMLKLVDAYDEKTLWSESFPIDAKLWPTASDEVAVFTRSGKLTVVAVADGAKRLEATVLPEPQLTEAFVLRTPDAYLLVTSSPLRQKDGVNVQPVPGGFGNPLINGYVYGFDRETKKQLFRTRVAGHGLTLNQPSGLPMLVFASQVYEQPKGRQMRSPEAVLFCVDKRNGRVLYDERLAAPINMVELQGEAGGNLVTMKTLRNTLRFTFTDAPLPPPEEEAAKEKDGEKKDAADPADGKKQE